jgi:hypothetical protein
MSRSSGGASSRQPGRTPRGACLRGPEPGRAPFCRHPVTARIATARAPVIRNHSQISRDSTASFTVRAPCQIEPGRSGTRAIVNSGSPGSWGSPRAIRRRVLRLGSRGADCATIPDTFRGSGVASAWPVGSVAGGPPGLGILRENPVPKCPRRGCLEVAAVRRGDNQDAPHGAPRSGAPCADVLRFAGTIRQPTSQRPEGRS